MSIIRSICRSPTERRTTKSINKFADQQARVLVTKDGDFVDSHLLAGRPAKLLLITTGNISNRELDQLLTPHIPSLVAEFQRYSFLEMGRSGIIIRG
jgi:predicted nuclease of predicted toxin-antitoxin system